MKSDKIRDAKMRRADTRIEAIYPLTPMQEGMLFQSILSPGSGAYVELLTCRIQGSFSPEAFIRAWQTVINRHDIFRTSFVWRSIKQPMQAVHSSVTLPYALLDWSSLSEQEQSKALDEYIRSIRAEGFRLNRAPLLRITVARLSENSWQFIWAHHHLLLDGWSQSLLLKEVFSCYESEFSGKYSDMPEVMHFGDFIQWLRKQDKTRARSYWQGTLSPDLMSASARIPFSSSSTSDSAGTAESVFYIPDGLTEDIYEFSKRNKITLNTLITAAWALLVSFYANSSTVVFGVTVSGRPAALPGVGSIIGLFINTLPLLSRIRYDLSALKYLKDLQDQMLEMREYEYTSLTDIHEWCDIRQNKSLFESIVVFENYPFEAAHDRYTGSVEISGIKNYSTTNYPLLLISAPQHPLPLRIMYDCSKYDTRIIDTIAENLIQILQFFVGDASRALCNMSILSGGQLRLLEDISLRRLSGSVPARQCIHSVFEQAAAAFSGRPALVSDGSVLSYRELNARANRLSHYLIKKGLGPEHLAGICMKRSPELVVAILAVLKTGGAYLPLDTRFPAERINYIIRDSGLGILITDSSTLGSVRLKELPENVIVISQDEIQQELLSESPENTAADCLTENLAYVIYTSGSTGRPKGTLIEHTGIFNLVENAVRSWHIDHHSRILQFASVSFDVSVFEIFTALCSGASLALPSEEDMASTQSVTEFIRRHGVTFFMLSPSLLSILENNDLPELRVAGTAGEACYWPTALKWSKGHAFTNAYGPTEITVLSCWYNIEADTVPSQALLDEAADCFAGPPLQNKSMPIGRVIENAAMYILNSSLQPVPPRTEGEICISGVGLARGYLGRPDLTAEKFMPDCFSGVPGSRLYRTGDLGRILEDGTIEYLGRIDDQVKIRGFRIEPGEVQAAILRHPMVNEALVSAYTAPDPGGSLSETRLVAYVVKRKEISGISENASDSRKLTEFLKESLPSYMLPSEFIFLEAFPLNASNKIDRKRLPQPSGGRNAQMNSSLRMPADYSAELLWTIWRDVLGRDKISIDDNFFELGGHSLKAMQAVSRIRETFGVELPLRELFNFPTISQLAPVIMKLSSSTEALENKEGAGAASIPLKINRAGRQKDIPLAFELERIWFMEQMNPGSNLYIIPAALDITGQLDIPKLEKSFNLLVRKQEILRSRFHTRQGHPVQSVSQELKIKIRLTDLSDISEQEKNAAKDALVLEETEKGFDISRPPLFRVSLIKLHESHYLLIVVFHHIIADGWSIPVLINELRTIYTKLLHDDRIKTEEEMPLQYSDYALWQREYLSEEILDRQLRYWKDELSDAPELTEIPTDYPRQNRQTFKGKSLQVILDDQMHKKAGIFCLRESFTQYMLYLSAFQILLHRYSGSSDIITGTPAANRINPGTENLIGFFVNTLLMRTRFSNSDTPIGIIQQVRKKVLAIFSNQQLPVERILEGLGLQRDQSYSPLFQTAFVFQNLPDFNLSVPGLDIKLVDIETSAVKYDLILSVSQTADKTILHWEYNSDLFSGDTIMRMSVHFKRVLEWVISRPFEKLSLMPLLTPEETDALLVPERISQPGTTGTMLVHRIFEDVAVRQPEDPALVFATAGATRQTMISYDELNRKANKLAHFLRIRGAGAEKRVGIFMHRSPEVIISMLGILKSGASFIPIDPVYPEDRIEFMLRDSAVSLVVSSGNLTPVLREKGVEVIDHDTDRDIIELQPSENLPDDIDADNLAYIIYTSGSTGRPKGTMLTHRGLSNLAMCQKNIFRLGRNRRILQFSSLSFDASVWEFVMALLSGSALCLTDQNTIIAQTELLNVMEKLNITTVTVPPSLLTYMHENMQSSGHVLSSLDTVIAAGEKCTRRLAERWTLRGSFYNAYGPTETTVCATVHRCSPSDSQEKDPPIGRALENMTVYVLNGHMQLQPTGVTGELYIGGIGLARGYLNRPDLTADSFVPDPFSSHPGARLYRTGDLVRYLPGGEIDFLGRIDSQVKLRGYRIETREIESALQGHELIQEAVVRIHEASSSNRILISYITLKNGLTAAPGELREFLRKKLPEFMLPSRYIILDSMPHSPSGKIDYKALPAPEMSKDPSSEQRIAPADEIEEKLLELASEVLGQRQPEMPDDFFSLGGHSLTAAGYISRINEHFGIQLPLREIFEHPVFTDFALRVKYYFNNADETEPLLRHSRDTEDIESLIEKLGDLSAEQIRALDKQGQNSGI